MNNNIFNRGIESVINFKDFDVVFQHFKEIVKNLVKHYNLFDFENDIYIKLWDLSNKFDFSKFKHQFGIDNFIFRCLKNFCITLYIKNLKYKQKYILCLDSNNFDKTFLYYTENYSDILFENLLNGLLEKESKILRYKFKDNYSNEQIGRIINMSRTGVYKSIKRSLNKIKKDLIL